MKEKIKNLWGKLDLFEKCSAIIFTIFVILTLVAFLAGRIFAGIISIVAIAPVVVALLMKKQVIRVPNTWIPVLAIILSIVLIAPYFSLFKINSSEFSRYNWNEVVLADMLPKPSSPYGEIISNSEDYFSLDVTKTTAVQYKAYIDACKEKGFTIDAESTDSYFDAYNATGYKISLSYYDSEMHITLDAAMELNTITWPDSELAKLLPIPKSTQGMIYSDNEDIFSVYIGNTSIDDYNDYVKTCEDKGFNVDVKKEDKNYTAKNAESYKVTANYEGNNVIYISITKPEFDIKIEVECVENWIFSKYDIKMSIDEEYEGSIPHGDKETFETVLKQGKHTISFESSDDDTLEGEVEVNITKDETIKLKISCSSFGIDVEVLSGTTTNDSSNENSFGSTNSTQIAVTMGKDDFKGMNYNDAEKKFREMGFTKFEYETVDTEDEALAETICYIEITDFLIGDSDFAKGDKFDSDATITFYSYKYEKTSPVFYSTNDYETAKKGNTGVFSYKNKSGAYDVYWIIDFDAGYVYFFTDGNGENFCDKVKIISGSLNDKVTITWNDGGDKATWYLHFKYVNSPVTLIVNDHLNITTEFTTADLDDALSIRKTKTIKEY